MEPEYIRVRVIEQTALRALVVALLKDRRKSALEDREALEQARRHWLDLAWNSFDHERLDAGIDAEDVKNTLKDIIADALG